LNNHTFGSKILIISFDKKILSKERLYLDEIFQGENPSTRKFAKGRSYL
jgi:hypothetical protein